MKKNIHYTEIPDISLVLPFELKMKTEEGMLKLLKLAADKVERQLLGSYCKEKVIPVIKKLRTLISGAHATKTQSIAIIVSPQIGKIYYFTPTGEMSNYWPLLVVNKIGGLASKTTRWK